MLHPGSLMVDKFHSNDSPNICECSACHRKHPTCSPASYNIGITWFMLLQSPCQALQAPFNTAVKLPLLKFMYSLFEPCPGASAKLLSAPSDSNAPLADIRRVPLHLRYGHR